MLSAASHRPSQPASVCVPACVGAQHRYNLPANYTPPDDALRPANASEFLRRFFVSDTGLH